MKTYKLKEHKNAQCKVLVSDDNKRIIFQSYNTHVIDCNFIPAQMGEPYFKLICNNTYSPTTRKQIGYFLKEYFPNLSYYDIKQAINNNNCESIGFLSRNKQVLFKL